MNKSESIGKLSLALSKLQGEIQNVSKDKQGYGYKYAELSSVLDIVRPLLSRHELAVVQLCGTDSMGATIETVLTHSSGEWLSGTLSIPITAGKGMSQAQAVGSCYSYGRRYALAALLGIAQTDNDAAINNAQDDEPKATNIQDGLKAKLGQPHFSPVNPEPKIAPPNVLPMQRLKKLICDKNLNHMKNIWCEHFSVATLDDLTTDQALRLIKTVETL